MAKRIHIATGYRQSSLYKPITLCGIEKTPHGKRAAAGRLRANHIDYVRQIRGGATCKDCLRLMAEAAGKDGA